MLSVGKLHSTYLFQIDSDLVLSDATPATQTTSSNRMKNMSSAGKLFYILFEEIMLIINIDQADLHYRWCAKVFLFSDGGKTALKNHARLNYFYFDYTVFKNTWSGERSTRRLQMEELGVTDRKWCAARQLIRKTMEMEVRLHLAHQGSLP